MKKDLFLKALGENIRRIRKEKGITQIKLGEMIGKDCHSIIRTEKGGMNCTLFYLSEIAAGLNVDITELIKGLP